MSTAMRLKQARQKDARDYDRHQPLPAVGDAVLFKNHAKSGFAATFLPGYRVVKKIDDSNYVIKHAVTGRTSQVHLKDLVLSPMLRQALSFLPPEDTFGRFGKYANCPEMVIKD